MSVPAVSASARRSTTTPGRPPSCGGAGGAARGGWRGASARARFDGSVTSDQLGPPDLQPADVDVPPQERPDRELQIDPPDARHHRAVGIAQHDAVEG